MKLFYKENPPITAQDIREFEANLGASLPEDYKAHLLTQWRTHQ
ncbi:SMI1/KNR4 family protein [Chryseobacterium koreense]|nr:SMI1/KNR4 family protein [Chryseobacterium koreense]MBB5332604.1 cell wall assembly regulator SMI1 [Chryseobacterium koreense]